jgi:hypothetical protein
LWIWTDATNRIRPHRHAGDNLLIAVIQGYSFMMIANFRHIGGEPLSRWGFGPQEKQTWTEFDMQNRIVRIDQIHSRAICTEVAERLRIILAMEQSEVPSGLKSQIDRLREMAAEFSQQLGRHIEQIRLRRGFIGMPSINFWSSRSSRTANAAVPKYANLKSDATTAARRATSVSRSMISSNTWDVCGPRPWDSELIAGRVALVEA